MGFSKYANASRAGEIHTSKYINTSNYVNTSILNTKEYINTNTINTCKTGHTVQACTDDQANQKLVQTLQRMRPAYKAAVKRIQEDPLSYRLEKILRFLRKVNSRDNYMQVVSSVMAMSPMEQAQFAEQVERNMADAAE